MKSNDFKRFLPLLMMTVLGHADCANSSDEKTATQEPHFIQYHNRVALFMPFHQVYERIKNEAFYVGVDIWAASVMNKNHENTLLDAELRMGYNFFFNGRDHFTPFAGLGFVEDFWEHHHHEHHHPGIVYGTMGFLYNHEFNTIFNLGVNGKFILGGPISEKHFKWGCPVAGFDIALPITFRFGYRRHWDFRLEPFYMYLGGTEQSQDYSGFRNTIGYRF